MKDMRVWDINPGYLNRQSLLGEHRELHGISSIIQHDKKGYSKHPETVRWEGNGWALSQRHLLLASEMNLRGYTDRSPVRLRSRTGQWPDKYINTPGEQFLVLADKYTDREPGRIPLPLTTRQLWAQHKYSIMARDAETYKFIGRKVASMRGRRLFDEVANDLTEMLRLPPGNKLLRNTLQHMWGHVSRHSTLKGNEIETLEPPQMLSVIQELALLNNVSYLTESTALGELCAWREAPDTSNY